MGNFNDEETLTVTPREGNVFYSVTVEILEEDPETGKIKKVKDEHLVDGRNVTDVESKVKDEMAGVSAEWKIVKCQTSKISVVY